MILILKSFNFMILIKNIYTYTEKCNFLLYLRMSNLYYIEKYYPCTILKNINLILFIKVSNR